MARNRLEGKPRRDGETNIHRGVGVKISIRNNSQGTKEGTKGSASCCDSRGGNVGTQKKEKEKKIINDKQKSRKRRK